MIPTIVARTRGPVSGTSPAVPPASSGVPSRSADLVADAAPEVLGEQRRHHDLVGPAPVEQPSGQDHRHLGADEDLVVSGRVGVPTARG